MCCVCCHAAQEALGQLKPDFLTDLPPFSHPTITWSLCLLQLAANGLSSAPAALLLDLLRNSVAAEACQHNQGVYGVLATSAVRGHRNIVLKLLQLGTLQCAPRVTPQQHRKLVQELRMAADAAKGHGQDDVLQCLTPVLHTHSLALQLAEAEHAGIMHQLADVQGQFWSQDREVVATLCRQPAILQRLSDDDIHGLLHNAIQQNGSSTVIESICRMRSWVAQDIVALLRHAVLANLDRAAVDVLCALRNLQVVLPTQDNVKELLTLASEKCEPEGVSELVLIKILYLPGFATITMDQFSELLMLACSSGSVKVLFVLLQLPAANSLSHKQLVAAVELILARAATATEHEATLLGAQLDELCKAAAAKQLLDRDSTIRLLYRAVQCSYSDRYIMPLSRLSAGHQVNVAAALDMLDMAVCGMQQARSTSNMSLRRSAARAVLMLCLMPSLSHVFAADDIVSDAVAAATDVLCVSECVYTLQSLEAYNISIQHMHIGALTALMRYGIGVTGGGVLVRKLCQLDSATQITGAQIARLVSLALLRKDDAAFQELCQLDGPMQHVGTDAVCTWILGALESPNGSSVVKLLCRSGAACRENLDACTVMGLLHAAIQLHSVVAVECLSGLAGAKLMHVQQVSELVQAAMDKRCCEAIEAALVALM